MNQVAKLEKEMRSLRDQLTQAETKIAERDEHVSSLQEQIRQYLSHRFAASSEKASPDQMGLFNEAEETVEENKEETESDTTTVKSHERRTKPRVSIPEGLPREEIIHDLPEEEKICPHDGAELKVIGSSYSSFYQDYGFLWSQCCPVVLESAEALIQHNFSVQASHIYVYEQGLWQNEWLVQQKVSQLSA